MVTYRTIPRDSPYHNINHQVIRRGYEISGFPEGGFVARIPPREDPRDHDIFVLLTGALYVTVNSKKDKGKALNKHIMKHIVPRRFDAKIEKIQEKHQQDIEGKDAAIALLNDGLKNREYENKVK